MIRTVYFLFSIIISLAVALSGCQRDAVRHAPKLGYLDVDMVMPPVGSSRIPPFEVGRVLEEIDNRNRTVEDDDEWIMKSYESLWVRRLTNVSSKEYHRYKKYLDNEAVYIIVHPAFFPFFHYPKKLVDNDSDHIDRMNVTELLLRKKPLDYRFAVLQAQERRTRDFLEFKSTQEKLIIMVIPKDYRTYSGYTYRKGRDEYMRYLNEVTNYSRSVLFVESRSPNRGYLSDDEALKLMEFLLSIQAKKVYVGGGYIGRCLEDFYSAITTDYGAEDIFVVPELSDVSPRELTDQLAGLLLKEDGSLDDNMAKDFITQDAYDIQERIPRLESLP